MASYADHLVYPADTACYMDGWYFSGLVRTFTDQNTVHAHPRKLKVQLEYEHGHWFVTHNKMPELVPGKHNVFLLRIRVKHFHKDEVKTVQQHANAIIVDGVTGKIFRYEPEYNPEYEGQILEGIQKVCSRVANSTDIQTVHLQYPKVHNSKCAKSGYCVAELVDAVIKTFTPGYENINLNPLKLISMARSMYGEPPKPDREYGWASTIVGGLAGGLLGSALGGSTGALLGGLAGAATGALVGSAHYYPTPFVPYGQPIYFIGRYYYPTDSYYDNYYYRLYPNAPRHNDRDRRDGDEWRDRRNRGRVSPPRRR